MGKNKLKKFAELAACNCAVEFPREELLRVGGVPFRGRWNEEFFKGERPIVVELGCGKGEYTVGLAKSNPDSNYIGIDIKGARMWRGAKTVEEEQIANAGFLRTEIENITQCFGPAEVSEFWITFPDPQMKKVRKRLTSTWFLKRYREVLAPNGIINLKTDSPFLYEYTRRLVEVNGFEVLTNTDDLYGSGLADPVSSIKTFYEQQWLSRGKKIKLLSFRLPAEGELVEPQADDIEYDDYHAMARHSNIASNAFL